jgi:hypothetical protein
MAHKTTLSCDSCGYTIGVDTSSTVPPAWATVNFACKGTPAHALRKIVCSHACAQACVIAARKENQRRPEDLTFEICSNVLLPAASAKTP